MKLEKIELYLNKEKKEEKTSELIKDEISPGKNKEFKLVLKPFEEAEDKQYRIKITNTDRKKEKIFHTYADKKLDKKDEMVIDFTAEELKRGYLIITVYDKDNTVVNIVHIKVTTSILLFLIPIGALILMGILVALLNSKDIDLPINDGPLSGTGNINNIEDYDIDKIKKALNENQNACNINAASYIEFKDVNSEGLLKLTNTNDYYIQVSILPYDDEHNDIDLNNAYFTSILIGPNEQMNKIKFDKNLDNLKKGEQDCLLYYDCYKLETNESGNENYVKLGSAGLKITVNLLNK